MKKTRVLALAGGKGGVGTSLLAGNLAIHLARQGRQVVLLDLSPAGAAAHAHVGVPFPSHHLGERLATAGTDGSSAGEGPPLKTLAVGGGIPNLKIIAGVPDDPSTPPRPDGFAAAILAEAEELPCDVVVADLGSGRTRSTALACRAATTLLLVTTPEPQSLRGLLHLHAAALHGVLHESLEKDDLKAAGRTFAVSGLRSALAERQEQSRIFHRMLDALEGRRFGLILNQVRTQEDVEAATRIGAVLSMVQAVVVDPVISLDYDLSVVQTTGQGKVLSQSYPNSPVGRGLERLLAALGDGPDRNRKPRGSDRYAPVSTWHHYRVLALDPQSSPRDVQRHYEWIRAPFATGGESETVAQRQSLDKILARVETAYRTLLFLENRREYDKQLVLAGVLERSALRSPAQEDEDQRGQSLEHEPEVPPVAGKPAAADNPPAPRPGKATPAAGAPSAPAMVADNAPSASRRGEAPATGEPDAEAPEPGHHYGGSTLKMLRQRRRLDLERIAEITKIRMHQIEALENDRYQDLPVPVFLRGFLKAYALCLDLDPEQVVRDYMEGYDVWSRMRP